VLVGHYSDDPAAARSSASDFLEARPIDHNIVLTLLAQRIATPEPGHYWWVADGESVVGFAMQSPVTFKAAVSPGASAVIDALVPEVAATAPALPGIIAEAATAAAFAGRWAERRKLPVIPEEGQRIYVLAVLRPPSGVAGTLRPATLDDIPRLVQWNDGFCTDTGQSRPSDPAAWTGRLVAARRLFLWDRGAPVSMCTVTSPIAGVSRVGYVYTPPEQRGHGYAAAVVSMVSAAALADGADRCMLYTQLSNPTSNAIYRRLGYEPFAEVLAYAFRAG
jgi:RimJ/RimL family protein N-acetyltransferase